MPREVMFFVGVTPCRRVVVQSTLYRVGEDTIMLITDVQLLN
jgi:hypothetical protein